MQISQTYHFKKGIFASTPVDCKTIPQNLLDIHQKTRSNPLKWKGQFSPQFIEILIQYYQNSTTKILDPFAGSGTVLFEAARLGIAAVGTEINPAAVNLASIYCLTRLNQKQRQLLAYKFIELTKDIDQIIPLLKNTNIDPAQILLQKWKQTQKHQLVNGLAEALAALITLADFSKRPLQVKKVLSIRTRLITLIRKLPTNPLGGITVHLADARNTGLSSNNIDLIITSPPYINVYNYHQKYRLSAEAMGWHVLKAARSEIGSNRKHRQNRILTVIQYLLDMTLVFFEIRRVLHSKGTAVFVVGRESMVKKTRFFNGELIAEIAVSACGFKLKMKQKRSFINRYGQLIIEDILHFSPTEDKFSLKKQEKIVRKIALKTLENALENSPFESKNDIRNAIQLIEKIHPSKILEPTKII